MKCQNKKRLAKVLPEPLCRVSKKLLFRIVPIVGCLHWVWQDYRQAALWLPELQTNTYGCLHESGMLLNYRQKYY